MAPALAAVLELRASDQPWPSWPCGQRAALSTGRACGGPWLIADLGLRSLALRQRHVAHWGPELSLMPPRPGWGFLLAVTPAGNIRYYRLALRAIVRKRGPAATGFLPAVSSSLVSVICTLYSMEPLGLFQVPPSSPKRDAPCSLPPSSKEDAFKYLASEGISPKIFLNVQAGF